MLQKASILKHRTLDAFLPAKGKETKVTERFFSNIIGVKESLVSYVTIKLKKIYIDLLFFFFFFGRGRVPACHPGMHALQKKKKRHKLRLNRYVL